MRWQGLLTLSLGILVNFFMFLILYVLFLALTALIVPNNFFIPAKVFVFANLVPAGWVSWLAWKRIGRFLKQNLGAEWEPDWEAIVKRLTGRL